MTISKEDIDNTIEHRIRGKGLTGIGIYIEPKNDGIWQFEYGVTTGKAMTKEEKE